MDITIYHNPRCTKSRQTLQLLNDQGLTPTVIEYLKTPPTAEELDAILTKLALSPLEFMRKNEAEYKTLNLSDARLSRQELIDSMVANPILIERPIVLANGKAAIGRPPENVLAIL